MKPREALDALRRGIELNHQRIAELEDERDRHMAALEAIIIRCREGDPRAKWLPVIDDIASKALGKIPESLNEGSVK